MSTPDWVEPVARYMFEVGLANTLKLSAIALVGSSLIGIPVIGWLIQRHGWRSPFPLIGALALAALVLLAVLLPRLSVARGLRAGIYLATWKLGRAGEAEPHLGGSAPHSLDVHEPGHLPHARHRRRMDAGAL